jgi:hypothetical protein
MIAQKFKSVAWVAGVALAATLLYIISLQVATERGRLEAIDHKIAMTKRDIRQLQTEMGTRASLRQLERWNGDVLALSAPAASQYLNGEDDISGIDRSNMGNASAAPPPVMASVMVHEAEPVVASVPTQAAASVKVAQAKPAPPVIKAADPVRLSAQDRQVQQAFAPTRAREVKPVKVAAADRGLLGQQSLGDIAKAARAETTTGGKPKP